MLATISRCPSSSVPKSQTQMHPVSKALVNQGVLELKSVENTNVLHLLNAHSEIVGISDHDSFCQGFRLGALVMLDVLGSAEACLED